MEKVASTKIYAKSEYSLGQKICLSPKFSKNRQISVTIFWFFSGPKSKPWPWICKVHASRGHISRGPDAVDFYTSGICIKQGLGGVRFFYLFHTCFSGLQSSLQSTLWYYFVWSTYVQAFWLLEQWTSNLSLAEKKITVAIA